MFERVKNELVRDIIHQNIEKNEEIVSDKIEDVLEKASKAIINKHLIFEEDVTYDNFLNMLKSLIEDEK